MTTYQKLRKNAKALSPVVASIILIAVTVAVSVAVAAWMGGMTIGFMGTSSVTATNVNYVSGTPNTITVDLKNTGTKTVTIASVRVNNEIVATADFSATTGSLTMKAGETCTVTISGTLGTWIDGNTYKIDFYDGSNQVIGSTQSNAPGA